MSTSAFDQTRQDVAEKVRKLLTQAEDPAATPEEAQTFTTKAQELMTKYSIELAMVSDTTRAGRLVERGWTLQGPYAGQKVHLANAVARANDCRTIYSDLPGGRKYLQAVGYPSDVEWVETLSRSLEIQLASALAAAARDKPAGVHGRSFAVGFIQGFIAEINRRLQHARRTAVESADSGARDSGRSDAARRPAEIELHALPPPASVALVLVAKLERVDEEFKVRFPRSRTVYSQVRLQSWSGYAPGREAGRRATLARASVGRARKSLSA